MSRWKAITLAVYCAIVFISAIFQVAISAQPVGVPSWLRIFCGVTMMSTIPVIASVIGWVVYHVATMESSNDEH